MHRRDFLQSSVAMLTGLGVGFDLQRLSASAGIDLQPFCDVDHYRFDLVRPWTFRGWTYATNGTICIRLPAEGPDDVEVSHECRSLLRRSPTGGRSAVPHAERLGWEVCAGAAEPWPRLNLWDDLTFCPRHQVRVRRCNCGLPDEPDELCGACYGSGQVALTRCACCHEPTAAPGYVIMPCKQLMPNGLMIPAELDDLIRALPRPRWHPSPDAPPDRLGFCFDGGEGLVATMDPTPSFVGEKRYVRIER